MVITSVAYSRLTSGSVLFRKPYRVDKKFKCMAKVDERHVQLAHGLADTAGRITKTAFRTEKLRVMDKEDKSPVTAIDQEVETKLRSMIMEHFPGHSVFGEEYGMELGNGPDQDYLWVIDPIDGTLSFITGKPLFGTLIALLYKGVSILGIIDQPVLGDRWFGALDLPTLYNGKPTYCRNCSALSKAYVYSTTPDMFSGPLNKPYQHLKSSVKSHLYGADCYAYGLLALGHVDIVFEADMKVFDYMAMVPIIQGAGGIITNWCGDPLTWDGISVNGASNWHTQVLAVGDPLLHPQITKLLNDI